MATSAVITCPECKKKFKGREDLAGKRIRCPACSHTFIVQGVAVDKPSSGPQAPPKTKPAASPKAPAGPAAGKPAAAPKAPAVPPEAKPETKAAGRVTWDDEEDQDKDPYAVTTLDIAPRCPNCANLMESAEAVICLHCGYNTTTRELPRVTKAVEHTGGERFLWLLPGIMGVVGILVLINLDLYFCLALPAVVRGSWTAFLDAESMRMWVGILSLFLMWPAGYYAFKRLVLNPVPPEKLKD